MKHDFVFSDMYLIRGTKIQEQKYSFMLLIEITYLTNRISLAQMFKFIVGDNEICLCSFRPVSYQGHEASGTKKNPLRF